MTIADCYFLFLVLASWRFKNIMSQFLWKANTTWKYAISNGSKLVTFVWVQWLWLVHTEHNKDLSYKEHNNTTVLLFSAAAPAKLSAFSGGCIPICNNILLHPTLWWLIVLDYCLARNQHSSLGTDHFYLTVHHQVVTGIDDTYPSSSILRDLPKPPSMLDPTWENATCTTCIWQFEWHSQLGWHTESECSFTRGSNDCPSPSNQPHFAVTVQARKHSFHSHVAYCYTMAIKKTPEFVNIFRDRCQEKPFFEDFISQLAFKSLEASNSNFTLHATWAQYSNLVDMFKYKQLQYILCWYWLLWSHVWIELQMCTTFTFNTDLKLLSSKD